MSTSNGSGIWRWNADQVVATNMAVAYEFRSDVTASDAAAPYHTYTTVAACSLSVSGTVNATRETSVDASVAATKFRVLTGEIPVGDGDSVPPFFRKIWADITFGVSGTFSEWSVPFSGSCSRTYSGPGAPPNTSDPFSGDLQIQLVAVRSGDSDLIWTYFANVAITSGSLEDPYTQPATGDDVTVTVDPVSLKKSGSDNFGFTWSNTTSNPGTVLVDGDLFDVTAWDVKASATVVCS